MYADIDFVMVVGSILIKCQYECLLQLEWISTYKAQLLLQIERHSGGVLDRTKMEEVLDGMVEVSGVRSRGEVYRDRSCRRTIWFYKTTVDEVGDEGECVFIISGGQ
jgi:hypothetical protein